jgi:hypothetical protein
MSIELPPDVEAIAQQKAASLGGSITEYLSFLIVGDEFESPSEQELKASADQIERAMASVRAGRTRPAKDALREIAAEFGLNPRQ